MAVTAWTDPYSATDYTESTYPSYTASAVVIEVSDTSPAVTEGQLWPRGV